MASHRTRTWMPVIGIVVMCWMTHGEAITTHAHTIETVIVADYSDYKYWYDKTAVGQPDQARVATTKQHIKTHISSLVKSSNNAFASLQKYNISIRVKLVDIIIMQTAQQSPWTETLKFKESDVEQVIAAKVFKKFVPYADNLQHTMPHDHAMIFTRFVIHKDNRTDDVALGVAKLSAECTPRSVSIIQDAGFSRANVMAHELGHSLGCEHDGTENKCKEDDGYVMSPAQSYEHLNRWQFSSCSAKYIKEYISNITRNKETCMDSIQNHHPTNLVQNASWFGQIYSADKQCEMIQGEGSFFCRDHYEGNFTAVCQEFICHGLSNNSCYYTSDGMADGSPCGKGKWCMSNKCVDTTTPIKATDTCFVDNQAGPVKHNKTCAQLVSNNPNICNDVDVKYDCCKSCQNVNTASVDVNTQCHQRHGHGSRFCWSIKAYKSNTSDVLCRKLSCLNPKNASECLNAIADDKTVCGSHKWCMDGKCVDSNRAPVQHGDCTWSDVVGVADYNVTCKQVTEPLNQWLCNKNSISKICCNTCQSIRRNSATCPFGDKASWCFNDIANKTYKGACYDNDDVCCESCKKAEIAGMPGCKYGDKSKNCDGLLPYHKYWCYDSKNINLCCGTCAKIVNKSRTGCEYGDKSNWCKANVANMKEKYNCYKNEDLCCESCHDALKSGRSDCPYGDHSDWCFSHIRNNTYKGGCYRNANFCCETCGKLYRADRSGCEYGDRNSDCPATIAKHRSWCYDQKNLHSCCGSCQKHAITAKPDCMFGDHYTDCDVHKCSRYTTDTRKGCCETCTTTDPSLIG